MKKVLVLMLGIVAISCTSTTGEQMKEKMGTANAASINCVNRGGRPIMRKHDEKGELNYCKLQNDTEVEIWEYYKQTNPGVRITEGVR